MAVYAKKWESRSSIALVVLLLLLVSLTGYAGWESLPVQVPRTTYLALFGEVIHGLELLDALSGRETRQVGSDTGFWFMRLVIENRSNAEMLLFLDQSAIVMPDGSSHTLRELCKGELASFVAPGAYIEHMFSLPWSLVLEGPSSGIRSGLADGSLVKLFLSWRDVGGSHGDYWTWQLVYEAPIRQKVFINSLQGSYAFLMNESVNSWIDGMGCEPSYRRDNAQFILDVRIAHASSRRRINWWFLIFPAWPFAPLSVREAEVVILVSIVSSTGISLVNNSFRGEARQYFCGDFISRDYTLRKAFQEAMESIPSLPALAPQ